MVSEFKMGHLYKCIETVDDAPAIFFYEGSIYLCITDGYLITASNDFRNVQNDRSNFEEIDTSIPDNIDKYKYNYI